MWEKKNHRFLAQRKQVCNAKKKRNVWNFLNSDQSHHSMLKRFVCSWKIKCMPIFPPIVAAFFFPSLSCSLAHSFALLSPMLNPMKNDDEILESNQIKMHKSRLRLRPKCVILYLFSKAKNWFFTSSLRNLGLAIPIQICN